MRYIEQIRDVITKKADELFHKTNNVSYSYIHSRIAMFVLDHCVNFLDRTNKGMLTKEDVANVLLFLNKSGNLEANLAWVKEAKCITTVALKKRGLPQS